MQCVKPISLKLSDEERLIRMSQVDMPDSWRFAKYQNVPCGKCPACHARRRSEWLLRLIKEWEVSETAYFFTLTYNDETLPYKYQDGRKVACVRKRDIQLFLKRLRRSIEPFKIRYFIVSEYGPTTYRPHYHGIIFNFPRQLERRVNEIFDAAWSSGFIRIDPVTSGRIAYVTSYCFDEFLPQGYEKNFMLCSRRPAIGSSLLSDSTLCNYICNSPLPRVPVCSSGGETYFYRLPKYYKEKLFTSRELSEAASLSAQYADAKALDRYTRQLDWLQTNAPDLLRWGSRIYRTEEQFKHFVLSSVLPNSPIDVELANQREYCRKKIAKSKLRKDV